MQKIRNNRKIKKKIVAFVTASFILISSMSSCTFSPHKFKPSDMILNDSQGNSVKFGMTIEQVEKAFGVPDEVIDSSTDNTQSNSDFVEYIYGNTELYLTFKDFHGKGKKVLTDVSTGSLNYSFVNGLSIESTLQDVVDTFTSETKISESVSESDKSGSFILYGEKGAISSSDISKGIQYGYLEDDMLFSKVQYFYYDNGVEYRMMFYIDKSTDKVVVMSWGGQKIG